MAIHSICILGGTGFVGGHLVQRLARDGHAIKILTRRRERHRWMLVIPGVSLVEADVHEPEQLKREFAGCDVVFNLVGIINEKGHGGAGFRRAHVMLPEKIVAACKANGIGRLLHVSALGADAVDGRSLYLRSKGEGEELVHASGLTVTSFRPSIIFGPRDHFFNRFARLLRHTPWLFPLACPRARLQPVYVGDVAEIYARAIERYASFGQRQALCGPQIYTLQELVEYTARVLGLRRKVIGLGDILSRWQAEVLEYLPGKPFSRDNYFTLQTDNVCREDSPDFHGVMPTPLERVVPYYLRD